jgi:hypothetical protein
MGWVAQPKRFLTGNRGWLARWRFQPLKNVADAFRLAEAVHPDEFAMICRGAGWTVRVRITGSVGCAKDPSIARTISQAVARAIGLDVSVGE